MKIPAVKKAVKKSVILAGILILFVFGCGGAVNPVLWKTYVERFSSPQQLIQPEKVQVLYEEMEDNVKDDPVQIFSVIEWKIQYRADVVTRGALNHLATTEEALVMGEDDCDGQAVVLCSVLRYAGYDAYAVIGPYHSWVEVRTGPEVVLVNFREGSWFVKFNESHAEWNYLTFFVIVAGEFLLLIMVFFVVFYGYERGLPTYVQESLGFIKYVVVIMVVVLATAVVMSRWWVPGLMTLSVVLLVVTEIIARLRR